MQTELLSPAKDLQTAIAAIDCGADAIYIGAPMFGARSKACNSIEDIKTLVEYAHKFYVKVYSTVNIILKDDELPKVERLITELYRAGVDALIIQDMAILKMAIENKIPPIPLHISTQCDNRILDKVRFFEKLGLSRVVLARELSLDEIRNIKNNTNIELECFAHGALCVSYSGQCYLSQSIGGRSANRGECAQPCRKKYSLIDSDGNILVKDKHLLSLKDFNVSKHLAEMVDIGVKSFKIEGRMKYVNYVKNVTLFYRKELDKLSEKTSSGRVITEFNPDINKTFNRGYTDYFLDGRKNCYNFDTPKFRGEYVGKVSKIGKDFFIIDTKTKLNPQDGLCFGDKIESGCLINKIIDKKIYPNQMPKIKDGIKVFRNIDFEYEKQINTSKIERKIGVDIYVKDNVITIVDEDKNTVYKNISGDIAKNQQKMNETFVSQIKKCGNSDFVVDNVSIEQDIPFMPISSINELRRELLDNLMQERIKNYKSETQKQLTYADFYKTEDDYHANVSNESAKDFYKNCNCDITQNAYEIDKNNQVELMRTKHCIKYALDMCKSPKQLFLVDEFGKKYRLKFDCKNCNMIILDNNSD